MIERPESASKSGHNRFLLLAFGPGNAEAIAKAVEGAVTWMNPASALQMHLLVKVCLDAPASGRWEERDYCRWVYDYKPAWQML